MHLNSCNNHFKGPQRTFLFYLSVHTIFIYNFLGVYFVFLVPIVYLNSYCNNIRVATQQLLLCLPHYCCSNFSSLRIWYLLILARVLFISPRGYQPVIHLFIANIGYTSHKGQNRCHVSLRPHSSEVAQLNVCVCLPVCVTVCL